MTRRSSALIAACLGILAAGSVLGQPRNEPARKPGTNTQVPADPVAERAAKLAEIDSWLRRLVGQYRLSFPGTTLKGGADCTGIGTGPGVHCLFSFGAPVMLFGVDTVDTKGPRIQRFQLNGDSTAEMGVSPLRGDAVAFQLECPVIDHYPPVVLFPGFITFAVLSCRRETRVVVEPEGRFVRIRQYTSERVLVCGSPTNRPGSPCEIHEFPSNLELTLERVQAPRGTSR